MGENSKGCRRRRGSNEIITLSIQGEIAPSDNGPAPSLSGLRHRINLRDSGILTPPLLIICLYE